MCTSFHATYIFIYQKDSVIKWWKYSGKTAQKIHNGEGWKKKCNSEGINRILYRHNPGLASSN